MIDYNSQLNREVVQLKPSGIRRFFDIANEMDEVISLSIGEPDFSTPWHVRQEGIHSLEEGKTWYSPNRGFLELRDEISKWFDRHYGVTYDSKTQVLVTVGGSEAIDLCIRGLLRLNDTALHGAFMYKHTFRRLHRICNRKHAGGSGNQAGISNLSAALHIKRRGIQHQHSLCVFG